MINRFMILLLMGSVAGTQAADYYVNDTHLEGDVYCTAIGDDANDGLASNRPMLNLPVLLTNYSFQAGDTVWMDTGHYTLSENPSFGPKHSGTSNAPVVLQGSTNWAMGGTLLDRASTASGRYALRFYQATNVLVRDVALTSGYYTVYFFLSSCCGLENVHVYDGLVPVRSYASINTVLRHCRLHGNYVNAKLTLEDSSAFSLENCSIWGRGGESLIEAENSSLGMRNTICMNDYTGRYLFAFSGVVRYEGDYNDLYVTNQAFFAKHRPICASVEEWHAFTGQDEHSLNHFPQLNGYPLIRNDGTLRSVTGTWATNWMWTSYAYQSPCIDLGDPAAACSNEPSPNGGRLNIGAFGHTAMASKSRTNAWLLALTYNDGGTARSEDAFRWRGGNLDGATVRIEYSSDGGATWTIKATNIAASLGAWAWTSNELASGVSAYWRVVDESDTNVYGQNASGFMRRSGPMEFYVNDAFTDGDVYCSAIGSSTNSGDGANRPMASVTQIISTYGLVPGDTIWIDTGVYTQSMAVVIGPDQAGTNGSMLNLFGSTNNAAGGSRLVGSSPSTDVLHISNTTYVCVRDITLSGGRFGLLVEDADYLNLSGITVWSNAKSGVLIDWSRYSSFSNFVCRHNGDNGCYAYSVRDSVISGGDADGNQTNGVMLTSCTRTTVDHWRVHDNVQHGVYVTYQAQDLIMDSCSVWSNGGNALEYVAESSSSQYTFSMSNTVLAASGSGRYAVRFTQGAEGYAGNYNDLQAEAGASVGYDGSVRTALSDWQASRGQDADSLSHNPFFTEDGHLMSQIGTWSNGVWVVYEEHSACIDLAEPSAAYLKESTPNGARRNIGAFGNTDEASRSLTNGWVLAVSYNSRDVLASTGALRWAWGNLPDTTTVQLAYSPDNGASWTSIVSGIALSNRLWWIAAVDYEASPFACWKIEVQSDTAIRDRTDETFILRNGAADYFMNDASTLGDVYCSAEGDDAQDGLSPATPKATMQALLDDYRLTPGDRVWVDTGYYTLTNHITFTSDHSGSTTNRVRIIGSTNRVFGGSLFDRGDTNAAQTVRLESVSYFNLENLRLTGARAGAYLSGVRNTELLRMECFSNTWYGIWAHDTRFTGQNLLIHHQGADGVNLMNESEVSLYNVTIRTNRGCGVYVDTNAELALFSSVVCADYSNTVCVYMDGYDDWGDPVFGWYYGDNNNLRAVSGAGVGFVYGAGTQITMRAWQSVIHEDAGSLNHDPWFVDDFAHTESMTGTWSNGVWVTFNVQSPCIDTGYAGDPYTNEPSPNGNRINMGAYGNTDQASMSRTNAWVLAAALSDGGIVSNSIGLYWYAGNVPTAQTFRLDYSPDSGASWTALVTGVSNETRRWTWNITNAAASPLALWRVMVEAETNVCDTVDTSFLLRSSAFSYYVNDASTNGDIYCTGAGNDANSGCFPEVPKASLSNLLSSYTLYPGDTVFIDTGDYPLNTQVTIPAGLAGTTNGRIRFIGSTNQAYGGSWLRRTNLGTVVYGQRLVGVDFCKLRLSGGSYGLYLTACTNCAAYGLEAFSNSYGMVMSGGRYNRSYDCIVHTNDDEGMWYSASDYGWVENLESYDNDVGLNMGDCNYGTATVCCLYGNRGEGFSALSPNRTANLSVLNTLIYGNGDDGLYLSSHAQLQGINLTVWSNAGAQVYLNSGLLALTNSILGACASGSYVLYRNGGIYYGEYNNLVSVGAANFCYSGGARTDLTAWQDAVTQDVQSISHPPLFADPGHGDFHLASVAGRFSDGSWLHDSTNSPCIDAGNPYSPYGNEPTNNGHTVNLGAYGNTAEASKSADSDNDNASDTLELYRLGTDPLNPDSDNDKSIDGDEYIAGTDPNNADSVFEWSQETPLTFSDDWMVMRWTRATGRVYTIERSTNLFTGFDIPFVENIAATPPENVAATNMPSSALNAFRVIVNWP